MVALEKILNFGKVLVLVGGLEIAIGCGTLPKTNQTYYQPTISSNLKLKLLQEDEYVVPSEIFDAYALTVDEDLKKMPESIRLVFMPAAGYIEENYLDKKKKKEFVKRLREISVSEDEIKFYCTLFTKSDIIVIRESELYLQEDGFKAKLYHERFHKKMKKLKRENKKDYRYMMDVSKKLLESSEALGIDGYRVRQGGEEFYAYLAFNIPEEKRKEIEEKIKNKYPRAYEIYSNIKTEIEEMEGTGR